MVLFSIKVFMIKASRLLLAVVVFLGALIWIAVFRLTSEVIPVLAAVMLSSFLISAGTGHRPWLWGLAVGIGTRIGALIPEPALSPEHIQKYGRGQPLPLPFGMTSSAPAQYLAFSVIIMLFPI